MKRDDLSNIFNSTELKRNSVFSILNLTKSLVKNTDYYNQFMHYRKVSYDTENAITEPNTVGITEHKYIRSEESNLELPAINQSRNAERNCKTQRDKVLNSMNDESVKRG